MTYHRKSGLVLALAGLAALTLSACDDTYVGGSVGVGVYYDSMMWHDYYNPRPPVRPQPPVRPVHPIAPAPPVRPTPPIHRPMPRAR